jgi:hypothetical protein
MSPAEKYYAFLDAVSPMNLIMTAELGRCFPIDQVGEHWTSFVSLRSTPRIRVQADLTLSDGGTSDLDFNGLELPSSEWNEQLGIESREPFGLDRPMRCRYLSSPDEGRSRLVFIGHHSVFDGRAGIVDLQAFIRGLDGQVVPAQALGSLPSPAHKQFPWQADREQLFALMRGIAARNEEAGPPEPSDWSQPGIARAPRFFSVNVPDADADALLAGARIHQTRAYAAIAASWLVAVAARLCQSDTPTLHLATPVDVGVPSADAERPPSPAVSVVGNRYRVDPKSPWELALEVRKKLAASMTAGEGELFFHLSRANSIQDLEVGARVVAQALATAPPVVSVTNLGIIDPGSDPDWLLAMVGYLAPAPNQIAFVSGVGYRGRLVQSATTDDSQLSAVVATAMVQEYGAVVRAMGAS